jgi:hypothetical protein
MNVDFECDVLGLRDDQGQSRLASDFRRRSSIVTRLVDRQATVLLRFWLQTRERSEVGAVATDRVLPGITRAHNLV